MFANQLTRILSYTKDLDIIKKINNKDDYLVTRIIDFFDTCYNDIFPIYDVKEEQRKRLINAVLDGDMPDKSWKNMQLLSESMHWEYRIPEELEQLAAEINSCSDEHILSKVNARVLQKSYTYKNISFEQQLSLIRDIKTSKFLQTETLDALDNLFDSQKFNDKKEVIAYKTLVNSVLETKDPERIKYLNYLLTNQDVEELKDRLEYLNHIFLEDTTLKGKAVAVVLFFKDKQISKDEKESYIEQIKDLDDSATCELVWSIHDKISQKKQEKRNISITKNKLTDEAERRRLVFGYKSSLLIRLKKKGFKNLESIENAIIDISDKEILSDISSLINTPDFEKFRSEEDVLPFINYIKQVLNPHKRAAVYSMMLDKNLLQNRNINEQLECISWANEMYPLCSRNIMLSRDILSKRTHRETMDLFQEIIDNKGQEKFLSQIMLSSYINDLRSSSEEKEMMKFVEQATTITKKNLATNFFTSYSVNKKLSYNEEINLAKKIVGTKDDLYASSLTSSYQTLLLNSNNTYQDLEKVSFIINNSKTAKIAFYISELLKLFNDKTLEEIINLVGSNEEELILKKARPYIEKINIASAIFDASSLEDLNNLLPLNEETSKKI